MLEREGGVYRNSAETDTFLDKAKPAYIGGLLEMANTRLYGFWGSLTEALRTGEHRNKGKTRRGFLCCHVCEAGSITRLPYRDEWNRRGRGACDCREVSLGRSQEFSWISAPRRGIADE